MSRAGSEPYAESRNVSARRPFQPLGRPDVRRRRQLFRWTDGSLPGS